MDTYTDQTPAISHLNGHHSLPCLSQDLPAESMSTEWTNEKHSLYLNSMEASFVNQLHKSTDLLQLQKEMSNPESHCAPHAQVLRRGCWRRICLRNPEPEVQRTNGSRDFLRSPWIQHFRSAHKPQDIESLPLQESRPVSSDGKEAVSSVLGCGSEHSRAYSYRQVLIPSRKDDTAEMSDQNSVDEDATAESTSSSKRMKAKTSKGDQLLSKKKLKKGDQVVPTGKPPPAEDIAEKKTTQK